MFNSYDLANVSLAKPAPSSLAEMYIPLWVMSSSTSSINSSTTYYLQKGGSPTTTVGSPTKLHPLSSNWSTTQKFAFEAAIYANGASGYCALYDVTSTPTIVSASQLSTSTTTSTVLRSGQFTLTPGHIYGVGIWCANSNAIYISKAHLVAFLS